MLTRTVGTVFFGVHETLTSHTQYVGISACDSYYSFVVYPGRLSLSWPVLDRYLHPGHFRSLAPVLDLIQDRTRLFRRNKFDASHDYCGQHWTVVSLRTVTLK